MRNAFLHRSCAVKIEFSRSKAAAYRNPINGIAHRRSRNNFDLYEIPLQSPDFRRFAVFETDVLKKTEFERVLLTDSGAARRGDGVLRRKLSVGFLKLPVKDCSTELF